MRSRWWLRLLFLQWVNRWRARPVAQGLVSLAWFAPALLLPAMLALSGPRVAAAALEWLLGFDMPMALLLAAQAGAALVGLRGRGDTEQWIRARDGRGPARMLSTLRLVSALRWPLALALASLLLWAGGGAASHAAEALLIALSSLGAGAALAWLLATSRDGVSPLRVARAAQGSGLAALSWVPLLEAARRLHFRRLVLLVVPAMLAAPMGAAAQDVLRMLAAWVPLLFLGIAAGQAARATTAVWRWLPQLPRLRVLWWTWRLLGLATLAGSAALWLAFGHALPWPRSSP